MTDFYCPRHHSKSLSSATRLVKTLDAGPGATALVKEIKAAKAALVSREKEENALYRRMFNGS